MNNLAERLSFNSIGSFVLVPKKETLANYKSIARGLSSRKAALPAPPNAPKDTFAHRATHAAIGFNAYRQELRSRLLPAYLRLENTLIRDGLLRSHTGKMSINPIFNEVAVARRTIKSSMFRKFS